MYLIFDTETTGLPLSFSKPISDFENWSTARCVQLAWQLHDKDGKLIDSSNDIIKPDGFEIPLQVIDIHKISNQIANQYGISILDALDNFSTALSKAQFLIGHNVQFDINIIGSEYLRSGKENTLLNFNTIDTMKVSTNYCQLKIGDEGIVTQVNANVKWVARDGTDMYKFKICVQNSDTGKIE